MQLTPCGLVRTHGRNSSSPGCYFAVRRLLAVRSHHLLSVFTLSRLESPKIPFREPDTTVYDGVHHTPLGRFSKLDCSTTKRVPIPNDTSSESSRRDVSNADLFGHRHYSNCCGGINHGKSFQGCVMHTVIHGSICLPKRDLGTF